MRFIIPALTGVATSLAVAAAPALAQSDQWGDSMNTVGLAAQTLADGETTRAIALLKAELAQDPDDPALLINLGIAQAQAGMEEQARASFNSALASRNPVELATANGRLTDSRSLARQAIVMLDRGEFRSTSQLTLRD